MTVRLVLLSGPLAVGKTAVADVLRNHGLKKISSSGYLRRLAAERGLPDTRTVLQELGDSLDVQTDFAWLVNIVAEDNLASVPTQLDWFVDAVRKPEQVRHFRTRFPVVLHVHLVAPEDVLKERFSKRARPGDSADNDDAYDRSVAHPNEQSSRQLKDIADLRIDLSRNTPAEAVALIFEALGGDA